MRLRRLQAREDLRVLEPGGVMPQMRARIERGAKLGEGPAFDQSHLRLRHVAARELVEKIGRPERLGDLVAAGLDVALLAQRAREGLEFEPARTDSGRLERIHDVAERGAARNLHLDGQARHGERRRYVPRGIARGGKQSEYYQAE